MAGSPGSLDDWPGVKRMFRRGLRSSRHFAIATVGEDGGPHLTPIASVILTEPGKGFFFDIFTERLGENLDRDPRVCVLAVDSGLRFWLGSLLRGRFADPPALRLLGTAGPRRPATPEERERWLRRVRPVRRLVGYRLLWGHLDHVRDLTFDAAIPVGMGPMSGPT